jgi:cobalt-zinc-cadmium efflux system membrane fusion protein
MKYPDLRRQLVPTAVIIVALCLAGFALTRSARSDQNSSPPATDHETVSVSSEGAAVTGLETVTVTSAKLDDSIHTTGAISYPQDQTVKIAPRVQGRIRTVLVRVGDRVSAGQTIAILDSVDAATAQTAYREAATTAEQASLNLDRQNQLYKLGTPDVTTARGTLSQARAATRAAKDVLDLAQKQERIGGFTQKPLEDAENALISANAALSQARSDLSLAQRDFDRKQKLVQIGVIARSDLEASQNALEKAQATVSADEESVTLAKQAVDREQKAFKSNLYADQQVRQAENAYQQAKLQESAAERALALTEVQIQRDLQQAHTDYRSAQLSRDNAAQALKLLGNPGPDGSVRILAPISGVITERDVNPGQVVDQSQETPWQMFVISNPDTVWIDADVHEDEIAAVHPGCVAQVQVTAHPDQTFTGRVSSIAPTLDRTSHTVKVRVVIPNRGGQLKDGMYASVSILTGGRSALVVPMTAVTHDQDADYAYVAQDSKYHRRAIKAGQVLNGQMVVTQGLQAGEKVAAHGALFLGSQISDD